MLKAENGVSMATKHVICTVAAANSLCTPYELLTRTRVVCISQNIWILPLLIKRCSVSCSVVAVLVIIVTVVIVTVIIFWLRFIVIRVVGISFRRLFVVVWNIDIDFRN